MNEIVFTTLRPYREPGSHNTVVILTANPPNVGATVNIRGKRNHLGVFVVTDVNSIALSDITPDDLACAHPIYRSVSELWRAAEVAYGSGLPGEHHVHIVTVTDPSAVPVVTPALHTKPPVASKYLDDDDDDDDDDTVDSLELDLDEDVADDDVPFERFDRKKSLSWDD